MTIDKPKNAIAKKNASSKTSTLKKRNIALYIIRIILMAFNGLALFAGLAVILSGEFGSYDVALFIYLLVFFLLGLFFVLRNKRPKGEAQDIRTVMKYTNLILVKKSVGDQWYWACFSVSL